MRARWRSRLGSLLLLLASSVLGLLAAEGVVRLVAPQSLRPAWDDEIAGIRVARPGARGRHLQPGMFDVTVTINAQRLRSRRAYAIEPSPGVTRLAVLGDSMAFGWGVGDDETYPAHLERILRAGRQPAEVLNGGYPGTCLGEKAVGYTLIVRPFHPDLVILTVHGDDVDGDLYWRVFSLDRDGRAVPGPPRKDEAGKARSVRRFVRALPGYLFFSERSQLFGFFRRAATRVVSRELATGLGWRPATPEEVDRFWREGIPLMKAELRWLRDRLREDRAGFAVVFVPFRDNVYPASGWWPDELRWKSRGISGALREVCAEEGLPFRDVTPAVAERARNAPHPLFYQGIDTHPTPDGYRVIAESVASFLLETDLLAPRSRP